METARKRPFRGGGGMARESRREKAMGNTTGAVAPIAPLLRQNASNPVFSELPSNAVGDKYTDNFSSVWERGDKSTAETVGKAAGAGLRPTHQKGKTRPVRRQPQDINRFPGGLGVSDSALATADVGVVVAAHHASAHKHGAGSFHPEVTAEPWRPGPMVQKSLKKDGTFHGTFAEQTGSQPAHGVDRGVARTVVPTREPTVVRNYVNPTRRQKARVPVDPKPRVRGTRRMAAKTRAPLSAPSTRNHSRNPDDVDDYTRQERMRRATSWAHSSGHGIGFRGTTLKGGAEAPGQAASHTAGAEAQHGTGASSQFKTRAPQDVFDKQLKRLGPGGTINERKPALLDDADGFCGARSAPLQMGQSVGPGAMGVQNAPFRTGARPAEGSYAANVNATMGRYPKGQEGSGADVVPNQTHEQIGAQPPVFHDLLSMSWGHAYSRGDDAAKAKKAVAMHGKPMNASHNSNRKQNHVRAQFSHSNTAKVGGAHERRFVNGGTGASNAMLHSCNPNSTGVGNLDNAAMTYRPRSGQADQFC